MGVAAWADQRRVLVQKFGGNMSLPGVILGMLGMTKCGEPLTDDLL